MKTQPQERETGIENTFPQSINWKNTKEFPLVDDDPDGGWIQSNHCPTGNFLAGLYVYNNSTGKTNFEWYKVALTDDGLMEATDDDTYYLGWDVKDIEFWAEVTSERITRAPEISKEEIRAAAEQYASRFYDNKSEAKICVTESALYEKKSRDFVSACNWLQSKITGK